MKNIYLLLILIIGLRCTSCSEDLLSKFHQNGYKLKDMRTEVIRFNKNIFHNFKMKTFKYNRTTPAHNVTIHPKVNLENKLECIKSRRKSLLNGRTKFCIIEFFVPDMDMEHGMLEVLREKLIDLCTNFDIKKIVVQAYKFLSGEYRRFPIRYQVNSQKAFESNIVGFHNVKMCGNTTSFVFQKEVNYYFCNFVADVSHFPPLIPNGIYKIEHLMLYLNQDAGLFNSYGEVYTPLAYPKK